METKTMETPRTRFEFERNFFLLREKICQGKFSIRRGIPLGIEKVRTLPNGRIDFLSVDESARSQANMIAAMMSKFEDGMLKATGDIIGGQDAPKDRDFVETVEKGHTAKNKEPGSNSSGRVVDRSAEKKKKANRAKNKMAKKARRRK